MTGSCASCKYRRRKCVEDCPLAPYFPPGQSSQRFLDVHHLFGVSNVLKIYNNVSPELRDAAMRTVIYESESRRLNPVHGCLGQIHDLTASIAETESELFATQQLIEQCKNLQNLQQQQQLFFPPQPSQPLMQFGGNPPPPPPPPPPPLVLVDLGNGGYHIEHQHQQQEHQFFPAAQGQQYFPAEEQQFFPAGQEQQFFPAAEEQQFLPPQPSPLLRQFLLPRTSGGYPSPPVPANLGNGEDDIGMMRNDDVAPSHPEYVEPPDNGSFRDERIDQRDLHDL